jgi:thiamine biosynthesis lipoprotein
MKKAGNQISDFLHHDNAFLMNTRLDIVLYGVEKSKAAEVFNATFNQVRKLEMTFSRFDQNAETYQINKAAFAKDFIVSPLLMKAIKTSIEAYHLTNGYFNIFAGEAYSKLKNLQVDFSTKMTHISPENSIETDDIKHSVRFLNETISLDFGGIGKGLAIDQVGVICQSFGVKDAFISFGDSSVLGMGHHPHGSFWPFALQNQKTKEVWPLNNEAVSVSSTIRGTSGYQHIINPVTSLPVSRKQSSCVQCKSATNAEIVSTALMVAPPNKHKTIAERYNIKKYQFFEAI